MVWGDKKSVKTEKWIKRSGTKYEQRPGRWAVSSIDELVWERKLAGGEVHQCNSLQQCMMAGEMGDVKKRFKTR